MAKQTINIGAFEGDNSAETIRSGFNKTNQMMTEQYDYRPVNVLDMGALGNSHYSTGGGADDTAEIQAAYDAAATVSRVPVVIFPGNRTYRISSSITIPQGVHTIGLGGRDGQSQATPPTIIWDGAAGGTMFDVVVATANIFTTRFENFTLIGKYLGGAGNAAATGIKFRTTGGAAGKSDSGTMLEGVWFQSFNGDSLRFEQNGATNFLIRGGRFDNIYGGYGMYVDLSGTGKQFLCVIDGNTNYVGGSTGQGKGFIFLDGESTSSLGMSHLMINGLHTETNQNLTETFAAGTNPYDKRGIIRFGVTSSLGNVQHRLHINGVNHSFGGGLDSHSYFQITGSGGTDDANCDQCYISVDNWDTLHSFNSADNAADDEVRMFGGRVPAARRYPFNGYRGAGPIIFARGKDATGEGFRSFQYFRHGALRIRGLGIAPETVADLQASPPGDKGSLAVVTDSNLAQTSANKNATVAGGGSNTCLVMWTGSNWVIV